MGADPNELARPRRRRRRPLAIMAALVALAALAVPALVDDRKNDGVEVGADGLEPAAPPPELPAGAAVTPPVPPTADAVVSATSDPTFTTAGRRPRPTATSTSTSMAPSTVTTAPVPVTQTTYVPSVPTTSPRLCPAPPTAAWTVTDPGFYLVPIAGGAPRPILTEAGLHPNEVAASPDGKRLIFSDFDPTENQGQNPVELYTVNADGTDLRRIETGLGHPNGFQWSPDGRWIAFHDQIRAEADIWVMAPDGTQLRRLFTYPVPGYGWLRWSPDSTHLAASSANDGAGAWAIDLATGDSVHLVTEAVWLADWSPDSKRLVVDLTDGSPPSMDGPTIRKDLPIIVINADGTGRRQLVETGVWAVWSPAGDGIALRQGGLIDPDTLTQRSYGPGAALAYAPDGEHLLTTVSGTTSAGYLINDRQGCSHQLVPTDQPGRPAFAGWAGTGQIIVRVLPAS